MSNINIKTSIAEMATARSSARSRKSIILSSCLSLVLSVSAFASDNSQPFEKAVVVNCTSKGPIDGEISLEDKLAQEFPRQLAPETDGKKIGTLGVMIPEVFYNVAQHLSAQDLYHLVKQDQSTCFLVGKELNRRLPVLFQEISSGQYSYWSPKLLSVGNQKVLTLRCERDIQQVHIGAMPYPIYVLTLCKSMLTVSCKLPSYKGIDRPFANLGLTGASFLARMNDAPEFAGAFVTEEITRTIGPMPQTLQFRTLSANALRLISASCQSMISQGEPEAEINDIVYKTLSHLQELGATTQQDFRKAAESLLQIKYYRYFSHKHAYNLMRSLFEGRHREHEIMPGSSFIMSYDTQFARTHEEKVADFQMMVQLYQHAEKLGLAELISGAIMGILEGKLSELMPVFKKVDQALLFIARDIDESMK